MIIIIFILFYLLPIFLIHIVGLYFWKKRTDCGKTIGDEAKLEKVEHAIKSRTDDVVDFKQKTAYEMRESDWSRRVLFRS